MSNPRINRLFGKSGNCFDVAIDHGMFNEASFLSGIESMPAAIEKIAQAGPTRFSSRSAPRATSGNTGPR